MYYLILVYFDNCEVALQLAIKMLVEFFAMVIKEIISYKWLIIKKNVMCIIFLQQIINDKLFFLES